MRQFKHRTAFTLVELLVVIAIIGVLVGMLVPAVQAARDAARRAQSENNLRQIGISINSFEQAKKAYPPAYQFSEDLLPFDDSDMAYAVSWAFMVLPYMEGQNQYDRWVREKTLAENISGGFTNWLGNPFEGELSVYINPRGARALGTPCDVLSLYKERVKPPDPKPASVGSGSCTDYAANRGIWTNPGSGLDWWNIPYHPKYGRILGPFGMANTKVPNAACTDGTSKIFAVGDRWSPNPTNPPSNFVPDPDGCGLVGSFPMSIVRGGEDGLAINRSDLTMNKFGSPRGDSAAFVYLDGHVTWVSHETSATVIQALSTIADGKVVNDL